MPTVFFRGGLVVRHIVIVGHLDEARRFGRIGPNSQHRVVIDKLACTYLVANGGIDGSLLFEIEGIPKRARLVLFIRYHTVFNQ